MSRNLESLIAQAADMRAAGYTWAAVAQKVRRKVRTCQQWPRRHPFEWEFHYQAARQARFEQIAHEADTHLHKLMRSDDPKVQLKAVELSMRFGAAAYSGLSTVEMKTVYRVNQAAGRLPRTPAAGFGTRSTVDSTPTWQPTGCRRRPMRNGRLPRRRSATTSRPAGTMAGRGPWGKPWPPSWRPRSGSSWRLSSRGGRSPGASPESRLQPASVGWIGNPSDGRPSSTGRSRLVGPIADPS